MEEAIVFGGLNSLDFLEVRSNIIRIPEVSLRIEEAQKIWDRKCGSSFSFQHFLSQENSAFLSNVNVKSLALAIVQLGLMDRYLRKNKAPKFVVGNTQSDSAALVAAGIMTFSELIETSAACHLQRPMAPLVDASTVVLKGRSLPKYQAYRMVAEEDPSLGQAEVISAESILDSQDQAANKICGESDMSLQKVLQKLIDDQGVRKIINIGPGISDRADIVQEYQLRDVQMVESIDIDPMLSWFWPSLRKFDLPLEQAQ